MTAALVGLWLTGNTINIMSLGGLALAIGILVDEAIVTVENTHVADAPHGFRGPGGAAERRGHGHRRGFLAMLCILSVFIPTFIMKEPVRSLFMPLTLAVGFSMIASYLLSSTLVPVLTVWLMRHHGRSAAARRASSIAFCRASRRLVEAIDPASLDRGAGLPGRLRPAALAGRQAGGHGVVSPGGFRPVRAPFSRPAGFGIRADAEMRDQDPGGDRQGDAAATWRSRWATWGWRATNTATNNMLLFMRGTDDGELRVRLEEDSGMPLAELRERLRKALPEAGRALAAGDLGAGRAARPRRRKPARAKFSFGFEPGDIVSTVMSFGSPTPVEVVVDRARAAKRSARTP